MRLLAAEEQDFYCHTLTIFERAGLEALVGGAYAFGRYTGIERHTKDLDIFVRPRDFTKTLEALRQAGYATDIPFPHWLGKAHCGEYFVDVIHSSGNGVAVVDDEWFEHAPRDAIFDLPVSLCPREEMIWSKAFIQERERFDGADVAHVLNACAESIDWQRLLRRFGPHWRVLLGHLVLFGFIYPSQRHRLPDWVMHELMRRLDLETSSPISETSERICRGTLLSRQQYLIDTERWGQRDARSLPDNPMSDTDILRWTAAIAEDGSKDSWIRHQADTERARHHPGAQHPQHAADHQHRHDAEAQAQNQRPEEGRRDAAQPGNARVRRLVAQTVLVGNARDQRHLPAEVGGAIADAQQDVADGKKRQVRRKQVDQRHEASHEQT